MSALFDEYKKKFLNHFKKDARLECKVMFEVDSSCMLYLDVKKNGHREAIRLQENEIASWLGNEEIIEEMTEEGFRKFLEKFEYCLNHMAFLREHNADGIETCAFILIQEKGLSEKNIVSFWNAQSRGGLDDRSKTHYLTYETFFGDVKFRFKRENDGWVRIE
jgi:hypothetical protein